MLYVLMSYKLTNVMLLYAFMSYIHWVMTSYMYFCIDHFALRDGLSALYIHENPWD